MRIYASNRAFLRFFLCLKFMTNTEKLRLCSHILKTQNVNEDVQEKYYDFIVDIFNNHWLASSTGRIVNRVFIDTHSIYKNKCFSIELSDGEIVKEVSFKKSIEGKGSNLHNINKAARRACDAICCSYKFERTKTGVGICEVTNKEFSVNDLHVDHYDFTFQQLVRMFIYYTGEDKIMKNMAKNSINQFNDKMTDLFIKYHNKYAKIRLINAELNGILG